MEIDLIDREQLEKLAAAGAMVTVPAALLLALLVRIEKLEEKIAALESNSRNSSSWRQAYLTWHRVRTAPCSSSRPRSSSYSSHSNISSSSSSRAT